VMVRAPRSGVTFSCDVKISLVQWLAIPISSREGRLRYGRLGRTAGASKGGSTPTTALPIVSDAVPARGQGGVSIPIRR